MIFIRPWFLIFLLIPFVFHFWEKYHVSETKWDKWIDKKFLPFLLLSAKTSKHLRVGRRALILLWMGFVLALAGPAFRQIPTPVSTSLPNTVIIFDLGPAMQGNMLTTGRLKLHDLLDALKGNRVGLVLYADKGFTAVPLTQDRALIRSLIPTLAPTVLPTKGQQPAQGFAEANRLIQQTDGKGRIIYLTAGGVSAKNIQTPYPVGVLGLDDSAISDSLKHLGSYHARTTNSEDIQTLLAATKPDTSVYFEEAEFADTWEDLGGVLCLILLPFMALTFRKGFLFVLSFSFVLSAQASFFQRSDQVAYAKEMNAVQFYREGDYTEAVQGFQNHPYNLGNALAYAGKIEEAIAAYAQALQLDPTNEDARFNKEYLEKQLPPPENSEQNSNQQESSADNSEQNEANQDSSDASEQEENIEEQAEPEKASEPGKEETEQGTQMQEAQSDQSSEEQEEDSSRENLSETEPETETEKNSDSEEKEDNSPFNQNERQVLNRLKTDPYRVLRYRLLQQARKK